MAAALSFQAFTGRDDQGQSQPLCRGSLLPMLTVLHALEGQLRAATGRAFPEAAEAAEANGKPLDPALGPASRSARLAARSP
jgi:hypothetical protein